jgi:hypothetical protein
MFSLSDFGSRFGSHLFKIPPYFLPKLFFVTAKKYPYPNLGKGKKILG